MRKYFRYEKGNVRVQCTCTTYRIIPVVIVSKQTLKTESGSFDSFIVIRELRLNIKFTKWKKISEKYKTNSLSSTRIRTERFLFTLSVIYVSLTCPL